MKRFKYIKNRFIESAFGNDHFQRVEWIRCGYCWQFPWK